MEALFSSIVGGGALRRRVLELIANASALAVTDRVEIHVMTFAFTDAEIAEALADVAARGPSITVRILADWSQRIRASGQQVGRLAALGLPNLRVRYSNDQPYVWDSSTAHMRWSYHASRGLLHHKTLLVLVNGRPSQLICGSFNWTATAARSYENLLIVTADRPGSRELISRVEIEFEALWSDGSASLSPTEAHKHYRTILEEYRRDPTIPPAAILGLKQVLGDVLQALDPDCYPSMCGTMSLACDPPPFPGDPSVAIAFNARPPQKSRGWGGHAERNRKQSLFLRKGPRKIRRVPLTITSLALDTIASASPGDTLRVAMYGLSARVPEYGAFLDAARRGVRLLMLLDRAVGGDVSTRLADARRLEGLPIEVRMASRMMHQKYLVNRRTAAVLTGTANMSTDASGRHLEHRIRVSGCSRLADQFCADFDEIWTRLSANDATALPPA
jgi:hypothetical protein